MILSERDGQCGDCFCIKNTRFYISLESAADVSTHGHRAAHTCSRKAFSMSNAPTEETVLDVEHFTDASVRLFNYHRPPAFRFP